MPAEAEAAVRSLHGRPVSNRPLMVMGMGKLARFLVRPRWLSASRDAPPCSPSPVRTGTRQAAEGEDASFVFLHPLSRRTSEDEVSTNRN